MFISKVNRIIFLKKYNSPLTQADAAVEIEMAMMADRGDDEKRQAKNAYMRFYRSIRSV